MQYEIEIWSCTAIMHHYIFFSLIDVKFLDDDVIIFSAYSVIIFGINSLKSIAIFKIFTLHLLRRRARNWCQFVGHSYCQNINQNLSILNLAIHSMNVEINSLLNLFLVTKSKIQCTITYFSLWLTSNFSTMTSLFSVHIPSSSLA
jgi:hypothetical protein